MADWQRQLRPHRSYLAIYKNIPPDMRPMTRLDALKLILKNAKFILVRSCVPKTLSLYVIWRTERDSNPRYGCPYTRVPGVRLQPLGHLSIRSSTVAPLECRAIYSAIGQVQAPERVFFERVPTCGTWLGSIGPDTIVSGPKFDLLQENSQECVVRQSLYNRIALLP